jgi:hypothetical protein
MEYYDAPLTREEFLQTHFMGDVPETIDAEVEAEFPPEFRRPGRKASTPRAGKKAHR